MSSAQPSASRKQLPQGSLALIAAIVGVLMICFVVATNGEVALWIMWFAIPLLMISLGYLFLVRAIPLFLSYGEYLENSDVSNDDTKPK